MRKFLALFSAVLFAGSTFAAYKLVPVTTAAGMKDGGMYVFERNSVVLNGVVTSNALQTTDTFMRAGLLGTETYVWKLAAASPSGFNIRNAYQINKDAAGHTDLGNPSGKTDMSMTNPAGPAWDFKFSDDGAATISNLDNSNRFIGETGAGTNEYRAYAEGNLATYGHEFTVYELVELGATEAYIATKPSCVRFGNVEKGASVPSIEVEVIYANLSDAVSYSGLTAPFSASGSISASGNKITVAVNPTEAGKFAQTLKIQAGVLSVSVPVAVSIAKGAADYDFSHDFTAISGFDKWGTTYDKHVVKYTNDSVVFTAANKSGNTITNMPVTKGQPVEIILSNSAKAFKAIQFACEQWTTKSQTITLWYSTDGGTTYSKFDPNITSTNFTIGASDLPNTVDAIKISFSSSANQVGIKGVYFDLQDKTGSAINNLEVGEKAVKVIENGQFFIIKNGVKYNVSGAVVR